MPIEIKTWVEQALELSNRLDAMDDLCGTILATLELNKHNFIKDDERARKVLFEMIERWRSEHKRINL